MKCLIALMAASFASTAAIPGEQVSDPYQPFGDAIRVETATRTIIGAGCKLEFIFSAGPELNGRGVARCSSLKSASHKYEPVASTGLVVIGIGTEGLNDCYLSRIYILNDSSEGVTMELACADDN